MGNTDEKELVPRDRLGKEVKPRQMIAFIHNGGLALGMVTRAKARKTDSSAKAKIVVGVLTLNIHGDLCSYTVNNTNFIVLNEDDCDEVNRYRTSINLAVWKHTEKQSGTDGETG